MNDFSPAMLIPAIEENLREFWGNCARSPKAECYIGPEMTRLYTGIPFAFFNGVNCKQLPSNQLDEIIDETISYYQEKHARWEWMVGPMAHPLNLKDRLENHGMSLWGKSIGMAINLLISSPEMTRINKFKIVPVEDIETLKTWAETVVEGFTAPVLSPSYITHEGSLGILNPSYRRYLGILDGQPVATSALLLGTNVAGIYCVSTIPSARKMGIGAAITQYALDVARNTGYSTAILQATEMGYGVYMKLGFKEFSTLLCYGIGS